ncbi:MAG TPA: hypothetical protein GX507_11050 [Clostridia bacterium]|nr:hypothetical protein [Clostridia bacterium]
MDLVAIPVLNGVLPRPGGGRIRGAFLDSISATLLLDIGSGGSVFLCPYSPDRGALYPAGVLGRIGKLWWQEVFVAGPSGLVQRCRFGDNRDARRTAGMRKAKFLFAEISGEQRVRAEGFRFHPPGAVIAQGISDLDLSELRSKGYPCIDGAGWRALGGHTEAKGIGDIPVVVYGNDVENGMPIQISANLGGLVGLEQAHTIEHAVIRSLSQYGLCTPRNLQASIKMEAAELKGSLDVGFSFKMPEVFGITSGGTCGNPLTNLAHVYLTQELVKQLRRGESFFDSVDHARNKTLSRLADELEISTSAGLRIMQGLKKGMLHEDTVLDLKRLATVLDRFPQSPWD